MLPTRNKRARKAVSQEEASYETSIETETHASIFTPLDVATREIRLLTLHPARSSSESLSMELAVVAMDNAPAFAAISYCWGDERITISVHGFDVEIPVDLCGALRHLRDDQAIRLIWADSICINQRDIEERNNRVPLMGELYGLAEAVWIWLGNDEEQLAGLAFRTLTTVAATKSRSWKKALSDSEQLDSLQWLFNRPWFSRLWIVQELAMAGHRANYLCGSQSLKHTTELRDIFDAIHVSGLLPDLELDVARQQNLEETIVNYAEVVDTIKHVRDEHHETGVLRLLDVCRTRKCANKQDHVYGLLGLFDAELRLVVDYRKQALEVFTDLAKAYITKTRSLAILYYTGVIPQDVTVQELRYPSWVPNWTLERGLHRTPEGWMLQAACWNASLHVPGDAKVDGKGLRLPGLRHTTVAEVGPTTRNTSRTLTPEPALLLTKWRDFLQTSPENFWRIIRCDTEEIPAVGYGDACALRIVKSWKRFLDLTANERMNTILIWRAQCRSGPPPELVAKHRG
ncbi:hypothetical protein LTR10_005731 [Elasticomyces elasticus]|nr:hypothetical protein LTR10_005731 [Elasticomyces elasticus]KAK4964939.1 hypothetical protein LTR42_012356 [Elasticomyces elasticus]